VYDGAIPSRKSVAVFSLLCLGTISGNKDLELKANQIFESFGGTV